MRFDENHFLSVIAKNKKTKRPKISNYVLLAVKGLTASHPINTFPPLSHDCMSILLAASSDKEEEQEQEEQEGEM